MKKYIILMFLILIVSYLLTVLAAEVPPQPTPPGPTGPEEGTGTTHDQPALSKIVQQSFEYNSLTIERRIRQIGFNLYDQPRFSIGDTVLSYGDNICENDKVDINLDINAEWFGKGGAYDTPPVKFYQMSFDEMAEQIKQKTITPSPMMYLVPLYITGYNPEVTVDETYYVYAWAGVFCSLPLYQIQQIDTSQQGVTNFVLNTKIRCIVLYSTDFDRYDRITLDKWGKDAVYGSKPLNELNNKKFEANEILFTNSIDKIDLNIPFNVVAISSGPKLNLVSYNYNNGKLIFNLQNDGDATARIDSVQFDKAATEILKPTEIGPGSKADFIYNIEAGNVKMDVYYSATEKGCLENTNFKASYELDLANPVQAPQAPQPIAEPKATAVPTQPIIIEGGYCDVTADVNNLNVQVGGYGVSQYGIDGLKKGESATVNDAKITSAVNDYLKYCSNDECIIPIKISADNDFELKVKDIKIVYHKNP